MILSVMKTIFTTYHSRNHQSPNQISDEEGVSLSKSALGILVCLLLIIAATLLFTFSSTGVSSHLPVKNESGAGAGLSSASIPVVTVETVVIDHDQDKDGILDLEDMVQGARAYVNTKPRYKDAYYAGGYPPPKEGVCTDVIWQAFQAAGYDLKTMLDEDIKNNPLSYPRVAGQPDPNIDFRRVQNLHAFFKRQATELTLEVKPGDPENLKEWQGGDIVIFGHRVEHIAVVSDRRRPDGVPLLLHNAGPYATEADTLLRWSSPIIGHYRYPK